jgi:PAS domain S-box-containing protein
MIHRPSGIKWRILLPLVMAVLVLLAASLTSIYRLHQRQLDESVATLVEQTRISFEMLVAKEVQMMEAQLDFLQENGRLQRLWESRDREALTQYAAPLFQQLRARYRITHFYLIEPDQVCFLRVHNPARHGDIIERATLARAADRGTTSWGLELGPLGIFALRVVRPWLIDGQTAGYLELGMEINHLTPLMSRTVKTDFFFIVDKSFLTREGWEEGLAVTGQTGDWDLFPGFVIADRSIAEVPPQIADSWNSNRAGPGNALFTIERDGRTYCGGFIPMLDAAGRRVGDIAALYDLTREQSRLRSAMMRLIVVAVLICGLLTVLFYILIGRIIPRLIATYDKLTGEIVQRERAEQELKELSARNEAILAAVPDIIAEVDVNKTYTWLNDSGLAFLGEDAIGKPAEYYFAGEQDTYAKVKPLFGGDEEFVYVESWQRRKDGAKRLLAWWCRVLRNADGTVTGALSTARDITEQKQTERELSRSEAALKQAQRSAHFGSWEWDIAGHSLQLSDEMCNIYGLSPGSRFDDLFVMMGSMTHPEDKDWMLERMRQYMVANEPKESFVHRIRRSDGEARWVLATRPEIRRRGADGEPEIMSGTVQDITEMKLIEQAYADSELRFRTLFESSGDAIMLFDEKGFFDCNESTLKIFGCSSRSEFLGKHPSELSPPTQPDGRDSMESANEHIAAAMKQGSDRFEWLHCRLDGTPFPAEVLLNALELEGKRILQAVVRDITDRKHAEKEISKFKTIAEHASYGVAIVDLQGNILYINEYFAELHGFTVAELLGKHLSICHTPEQMRDSAMMDPDTLSAGAFSSLEVWHKHRDGRVFPTLMSGVVIKDKNGKPSYLTATASDITEIKRKESALRESEEYSRSIIETANDAFVAINADGLLIDWNRQAENIFGWTRTEILGRPITEIIIPPGNRQNHLAGLNHFLSIGEGPILNERVEINAVHRDGHEFPVELTVWPVRFGQTTYFNAFLHDITVRKQTEEQLRSSREEAEAVNVQLEKVLHEVSSMAVKAEAASMAKSEFLANMSHEIRTPMNGIIGMTDLCLDTEITEEQREYLSMVKSSSDQLLTIINDILDFSKIEAGQMVLEAVEFSLRETIEAAIEAVTFKANEKGLEFVNFIDPLVPDRVVGDPVRLRQIILNLVGNAVKFTLEGEVVIRVELEASDGPLQFHFSVSDTGIGIPRDKQEAVFDSFTQADGSTTRKFGGTGLGTTISRQLVELMGGTIWVESPTNTSGIGGPGTTFHFVLTMDVQEGQPSRMNTGSASPGTRSALIVDDNPNNRHSFAALLDLWGLDHREAPDGREALAAMQRAERDGRPFELIILDLGMPDMDGWQVLTRMKTHGWLERTRVILLSSTYYAGEIARAREAGAHVLLRKPVKDRLLRRALVEALGSPRTHSAVEVNPADENAETDRQQQQSPASPAMPGKILLVEDNLVNQLLARKLLEKRGYGVTLAENGQAALDVLDREEFDAVLMDVQMPVMGGFKATAHIRRREQTTGHHLPIIAMTANALDGDREKCLTAGMDDYVSKPIRPQILYACLEKYLKPPAARDNALSNKGASA